jgi:hypothetical protein
MNQSIGLSVNIKGEGTYMSPDSIEYGSRPMSMEDMLNDDVQAADPQYQESIEQEAVPVFTDTNTTEKVVVEEAYISESQKPDFDLNSTQDARYNKNEEGGVLRTGKTAAPELVQVALPVGRRSLTPDENVSRVIADVAAKKTVVMDGTESAKALRDDGIADGGVFVQRSPRQDFKDMDTDGAVLKPTSPNISEKTRPGNIEVSGFVVRNPKTAQFENVTQYFDDIESAMAMVSDNKYLFIQAGVPKLADIISGKPIIVKGDKQVAEYVNGSWRKI